MKALLCAITLLLISHCCTAQHVYQIRADSVRIYNVCDTAELILENHTQDTLGFLYNKGKGRTEFRKLQLQKIGSNAIAIQGQDTLDLSTLGDNRYPIRSAASAQTSGPGWYRIAVNGPLVTGTAGSSTSGSRAHARFIITDMTSGLHQTVEFIASVHFSIQPVLRVLSNSTFNSYPFAAIRLTKASTYDGSAVEVLTTRGEALNVKVVVLDNEQSTGWTTVNWQKVTSATGLNDGLPAGFAQINFSLNTGATEGTADETGTNWQFSRGGGLQTNGGFRSRTYLNAVGDYTITQNTQKIIWTIGDNWTSLNNFYGIGYDYGSQSGVGTDHQFVIASNGVIAHRFNLSGGVSLTGQLKVSGIVTAPGFYQSSLRSLKKDINAFTGNALELIKGLNIMEFTYKDDKDDNRHIGIIADESDWHFATKNHDKFDTNSTLAITLKAVQELTSRLEELNRRIDALEKSMK